MKVGDRVVVVGIGVSVECLSAIAALGEEVVVFDAFSEVPSEIASSTRLVLVVTRAHEDALGGARAMFDRVPILVFVDDEDDAPRMVDAGADYVLAANASPAMVVAAYRAATKVASQHRLEPVPISGIGSIAALRSSEHRYRMLMESAGDAIIVVDFDSARIIEANAAAVAMFGYDRSTLRQMTPRMLAGRGGEATVSKVSRSVIETGKAVEHRHPMQRQDGSHFWATVQLSTFHFTGQRQYMAVIRDVSDQVAREQALELSVRQLADTQSQLQNASRMAALGQMAAGIAHEINNPLQSILAGVEELDLIRDASPDTAELVDDMRAGAERIRTITRSLLPFARVSGAKVEAVDVNELVEWAARVTANDIRHRARLELELKPVPAVMGERARLGQLVTHLLTNAAHAIEEGASERHRIRIATEVIGERVQLSVTDTGAGIPEEVQGRIFDPFFTTKAREVGTGLGLSLCAEIVARQHGTIEFKSVVGGGTTFVVTLGDIAEPTAPRPRESVIMRRVRRARVLLIDDEEAVVRTFKRFLRDYDVEVAVGGAAALAILAKDTDFDVILCDLMMPNVDGPMVYAEIERIAPALVRRILFCSGGAFTPRVRGFLEEIANVVLDKPVSSKQLIAALETVISGT